MEQPAKSRCQIQSLASISLPFRISDWIGYVLVRARLFLKRRWTYLLNIRGERRINAKPLNVHIMRIDSPHGLQPGDIVRIKSRQEIMGTLDNLNYRRGCLFMQEMWRYCGSVQKVRKCVRKFLDERDYKLKKCTGIIILEGLMCEGTRDFGDCDRSCFFFWREEWLEKIGQESSTETIGPGQNIDAQFARPE